MVYMCFACSMSELFSLSVHHGGYFTDDPRKYVGGKVDTVDIVRDGPRYKAKGARAPPGPKKKNF